MKELLTGKNGNKNSKRLAEKNNHKESINHLYQLLMVVLK